MLGVRACSSGEILDPCHGVMLLKTIGGIEMVDVEAGGSGSSPVKVDDHLVVREIREEGVLVVGITGRITSTNSFDFSVLLESMLLDDDPALILDFEHLSYISSAGLRIVILMSKKLDKRGGRVGICGLKGVAQEVFHISGLDRIIPIYASRSKAMEEMLGAVESSSSGDS